MIENGALQSILATAADIAIVCETYSADAIPSADGFDPVDALDCFAAVDGITFRGQTYKRLVKKFGSIKRTITKEINNASVTFSNVSREISDFEFTTGFEGLILVIRLISQSRSTALTDSQILFAGRCEKPDSGDKDALTVQAKFVIGSMNVNVPRRKYGPEDHKGRVPSDPEFEGFIFTPRYGTTSYSVRKRNPWGALFGVVGFFLLKKTVKKTLQWSSYSDIDANNPVAEVFGRAQVQGVHLTYTDEGAELHGRTAFCEGEIEDITNYRSTDDTLPLFDTYQLMGLAGTLNGPDDPGWGGTTGAVYFSRTAHMRWSIVTSTIESVDPAPDVVAVILGRKMTIPGDDDVWDQFGWTDNAAAQVIFLLTDPDYYRLDTNWIDYDYATECYRYNEELIFNSSLSDFLFVDEG